MYSFSVLVLIRGGEKRGGGQRVLKPSQISRWGAELSTFSLTVDLISRVHIAYLLAQSSNMYMMATVTPPPPPPTFMWLSPPLLIYSFSVLVLLVLASADFSPQTLSACLSCSVHPGSCLVSWTQNPDHPMGGRTSPCRSHPAPRPFLIKGEIYRLSGCVALTLWRWGTNSSQHVDYTWPMTGHDRPLHTRAHARSHT